MTGWGRTVAEFESFLREHRGLATGTIENHRRQLRRWVRWLRRARVAGPSTLRVDHIDAYLAGQRRRRSRWSLSAAAKMLRTFLRFLRLSGRVKRDLSELVLLPRIYALAHVPRFLRPEQVQRVLAQIDTSTPMGARDHAMIGLMLGLGLRRGEVAALRLIDLDLAGDRILIRGIKSSDPRWMALTPLERGPLQEYLKVRPPSGRDEALFLRVVGARPLRGISPEQIGSRASRYLRAAGIARGGCHLFRHTFAQRMVDGGAPLSAVQKRLRHRSSLTTRIYTKVALEMLREVAENDSLHF